MKYVNTLAAAICCAAMIAPQIGAAQPSDAAVHLGTQYEHDYNRAMSCYLLKNAEANLIGRRDGFESESSRRARAERDLYFQAAEFVFSNYSGIPEDVFFEEAEYLVGEMRDTLRAQPESSRLQYVHEHLLTENCPVPPRG